jgi:hypothetical protein
MVVQARTLEFYDQYGFAAEVVEQGIVAETAHVREGGSSGSREVLSISFNQIRATRHPAIIQTLELPHPAKTAPGWALLVTNF